MDPATQAIIVSAVVELIKGAIQGTTAYMRTQGMTEAEIDAAYAQIKPEFLKRDPAKLADV